MKIEDSIFLGYFFNKNKAIEYGFKENSDKFIFNTSFLQDKFLANIEVDVQSNKVYATVFEKEFMEEYTLFRVEGVTGEFPLKVKSEYEKILLNIRDNCFFKENFISTQGNEISALIYKKWGINPEFLWEKYEHFGIFRNQKSKKWFAIIMNIDGNKIDAKYSNQIDVLNVKLNNEVSEAVKVDGIYSCYHMSKKYWVTIVLDNTLSNEEVMKYIELSFKNSTK